MENLRRLFAFVILNVASHHAWGWLPPHPNATTVWESVHSMRLRLNLEFNYTPIYIHPEMCRYLTEDECEYADMALRNQQAGYRRLQISDPNPQLGRVKVLVLMVLFTDHTDRELIPKSEVDLFWQTKAPDWISANSQGVYEIDAEVIDWLETDNTEIYYSFGKQGIVPEAQQMAWPILDSLDSMPNWDWSQYDSDGDGKIDSVVMIHSGYGAETTTPDCFGREHTDRIWAHAFTGNRDAWESADGNYKMGGYTIASAFLGDCDTEPAKIGLTVHEYMHTLGLVDLYDGVDPLAHHGVGAFDIMAYPYGQGDDENKPGHLSPWSKVLTQWLTPKELTQDGVYTLKAAEISDEAYRIDLTDFGFLPEYLLIENRQPLEFDVDIWSSGLVIYHVDDAADLQNDVGHLGQEGWPQNGKHYQVVVVQKDGNYDLEKGVNQGDAGDMWEPEDVLGPGMGGTVYPNTDSYQQGFIFETGIRISVLSKSGTDVTFCVTGLGGSGSCDAEMLAGEPSPSPTVEPGFDETESPSWKPSASSSTAPTGADTETLSLEPSFAPSLGTLSGAPSSTPSEQPSLSPSMQPSAGPTTTLQNETLSTEPSEAPTLGQSELPSLLPSLQPSVGPTSASISGTPSTEPSEVPSLGQSEFPSLLPSLQSSVGPISASISGTPSTEPSEVPSLGSSLQPSAWSALISSGEPSMIPTEMASSVSSLPPSALSTGFPSEAPSGSPSSILTTNPTQARLTPNPTRFPSKAPTSIPSISPSLLPSFVPTNNPSKAPSLSPTIAPTVEPSATPSLTSTHTPSSIPTMLPSISPSKRPSMMPTLYPSSRPSSSSSPTTTSSVGPTNSPTPPFLSDYDGYTPGPDPEPYLPTIPRPPPPQPGPQPYLPTIPRPPPPKPSPPPTAIPTAKPTPQPHNIPTITRPPSFLSGLPPDTASDPQPYLHTIPQPPTFLSGSPPYPDSQTYLYTIPRPPSLQSHRETTEASSYFSIFGSLQESNPVKARAHSAKGANSFVEDGMNDSTQIGTRRTKKERVRPKTTPLGHAEIVTSAKVVDDSGSS